MADPRSPTEATASVFTDADLFNCCRGGVEPEPHERQGFAHLELSGVRHSTGGNGLNTCRDEYAEFWSIYARQKDGLAYCITDGPPGDRARTMQIADHLARRWGLKVEIG